MSTVLQQAAPRPVRIDATLTVRWSISRSGVRAARPDLPRPEAGEPVVLEVCAWSVNGRWTCEAALVDGGRRDAVLGRPIESGGWLVDAETGLEHLDLPGALHTTCRRTQSGVRLLYACTPVLAALGIAGGRYELVSE